MRICGIYKITSPSGRVYIGQSVNMEDRWESYKYEGQSNKFIKRSIKKYGYESLKFEVIENCLKESLDEREIYWIAHYKSNCLRYPKNKGLNMTDGGKTFDKNTKKKYDLKRLENLKNIFKERRAKNIHQVDKEGLLVKVWENPEELYTHPVFDFTGLTEACKGRRKSHKNYFWFFQENYVPLTEEALKTLKRKRKDKIIKPSYNERRLERGKGIYQFDLEGKFIKEWPSALEIERVLGFTSEYVNNVCKSERNSFKDYVWRYKKDCEFINGEYAVNSVEPTYDKKLKRVVNLDTGIVYASISECQRSLGIKDLYRKIKNKTQINPKIVHYSKN